MVDLHTHFLPYIDDGANDKNESLSMLEESYRQGITVCAATPHCVLHCEGDIKKFMDRRAESFAAIEQDLSTEQPKYPMLIFGAEIYLDNDIRQYKDVELLCIGETPYMLIELPCTKLEAKITEWIYELMIQGIKPIIAHVERYSMEELSEIGLLDLDVVYQINASQFLRFMDRRRLKRMFHRKLTHIVCSDMHNMEGRACNMLGAYSKAGKAFPDMADKLFHDNPKKILGTHRGIRS